MDDQRSAPADFGLHQIEADTGIAVLGPVACNVENDIGRVESKRTRTTRHLTHSSLALLRAGSTRALRTESACSS